MDDIILEQSVLQAKSSPGIIQDMYAVRQEFILPDSSFLQVLINHTLMSKKFIYANSYDETSKINCATQAALETINQINLVQDRFKFGATKRAYYQFFATNLPKISKMTCENIDAVMSMLPETALPRILFGKDCLDLDQGHIVRVVGHY